MGFARCQRGAESEGHDDVIASQQISFEIELVSVSGVRKKHTVTAAAAITQVTLKQHATPPHQLHTSKLPKTIIIILSFRYHYLLLVKSRENSNPNYIMLAMIHIKYHRRQ